MRVIDCRKGSKMIKRVTFPTLTRFVLLFSALWVHIPTGAFGSDGKPFVFPALHGWKQSGEIQVYQPENLFDYIDGAADLYLSYDFQELKVAEYQNERKASVIIEVYRHKTPAQAFGIYSQERFSNANFLDIGAQGYSEKDILNFLTGNYYVKMNSFKTGPEGQEVLLNFAEKVAENLGEKGMLPSILTSFPEEGKKKNSEKFIAIKFLGYSFLHSAFTADYELSEKKFKLFIIEGAERDDCREMIQRYLKETGSPEANITEGCFTIADRHHGEMELHWKGRYILGTLNLNETVLRSKYLNLFEEAITRSQQKK